MDTRAHGTGAELATFLGLTFALSAVFWWLIIAAGSLGAHGGAYVFALMWCPGVSALATRLAFQRDVRGEGWRWGETRWAALAYVLPLGYATAAYALVWLAGLGGVDLGRFRTPVATFLVLGSLQSLLSATGEELGWRGFLVPTLARTMSFGRTAVVSGAIWAAWHVPLIAFADYNAGTPTWYAVLCFAVMVVSLAVPLAWLRLRSGSGSSGDGTTCRARQNIHAVAPIVTASAAPNSLVSQRVGPVSTVTRSKNPCTNRLCVACRIAAGHTLPDRRRSHANGTPRAVTITTKQSTEYHVGVPPL